MESLSKDRELLKHFSADTQFELLKLSTNVHTLDAVR
jgi:hypothetical protein